MASGTEMNNSRSVLQNLHNVYLEALRHREQEILRYIALLVPAIAGFYWIVQAEGQNEKNVAIGLVGVIFLLLLGSLYSLALGFNYRYLTLQLAKVETKLGIQAFMLRGWPRTPAQFKRRYRIFGLPWCSPPEVIRVFWWGFIAAILGVCITAFLVLQECRALGSVLISGAISVSVSLIAATLHGKKLISLASEENDEWLS